MTRDAHARRPTTGIDSAGKPWNVIVLNDNHNTFQGVAFALSSTIPGVDYDKGMGLADRIHNTRPRGRLERPQGAGRALLGEAQRLRPDDGAARTRFVSAGTALVMANRARIASDVVATPSEKRTQASLRVAVRRDM